MADYVIQKHIFYGEDKSIIEKFNKQLINLLIESASKYYSLKSFLINAGYPQKEVEEKVYGKYNGSIAELEMARLTGKMPSYDIISKVVHETQTDGKKYYYSFIVTETEWEPMIMMWINIIKKSAEYGKEIKYAYSDEVYHPFPLLLLKYQGETHYAVKISISGAEEGFIKKIENYYKETETHCNIEKTANAETIAQIMSVITGENISIETLKDENKFKKVYEKCCKALSAKNPLNRIEIEPVGYIPMQE